MMDELKRELWRLASDLSVEDTAILIAGGDPSEVDWEDDTFGRQAPVKRTSGHPAYLAVFAGLTNAVRKGQLRAKFHYRASFEESRSQSPDDRLWIASSIEIDRLSPAGDSGVPPRIC